MRMRAWSRERQRPARLHGGTAPSGYTAIDACRTENGEWWAGNGGFLVNIKWGGLKLELGRDAFLRNLSPTANSVSSELFGRHSDNRYQPQPQNISTSTSSPRKTAESYNAPEPTQFHRLVTACHSTFPSAMGRYDFRALRVRQAAKALVDAGMNKHLPLWYNTVGNIPPSDALARPVLRAPRPKGNRKPSRMFQPMPIVYPEDHLRKDFFGDHPWELARPRIILEDSGNDAQNWDWSKIQQPGKALDGER